ncbi:hypothetical protein [Agathobacter sp.]|uniref:hypothetical protein n=1 Tax=Agathobacter sp. TaxID=2021311 RepID=UPI003AB49F46
MNQNKKKMMKSKLKYYAKVIGVNLLAILVPILGVILIYGIGKLKSIYTNPYAISQEIYDCCLWAIIVVLAGFFVGFWLLSWADKWRKAWLTGLRIKNEFDELGIRVVVKKIHPNEKKPEFEDSPTSDDSVYEDISGLTVKEIWELYKGREIDLLAGKIFIAGYDEESSLVVVGTKSALSISYDEMVESMASKDPDKWHIEKGYANYGALSTKYIHIPIYKNRHQ